MEDRVISVETQIALLQKDIAELRARSYELPAWFKKSAITVVGMLFLQLSSTIWWAAEITTNIENLKEDVEFNTTFRQESPRIQQQTLIELQNIKADQKYMFEMMKDIKEDVKEYKHKVMGDLKAQEKK